MATLFHIPTTDGTAGQDAGMRARAAFADAAAVKNATIAPAGRARALIGARAYRLPKHGRSARVALFCAFSEFKRQEVTDVDD